MVATTPGRPCAAGSRSASRWQPRRSRWYGVAGVGVRSKHGRLFLDFRWRGVRCREFTELTDTPENRRRCTALLRIIKGEIALGTFDYRRHFPNGTRLATFYPEVARSGHYRRIVSLDLACPTVSLPPRWHRCRDGGVASVHVEA